MVDYGRICSVSSDGPILVLSTWQYLRNSVVCCVTALSRLSALLNSERQSLVTVLPPGQWKGTAGCQRLLLDAEFRHTNMLHKSFDHFDQRLQTLLKSWCPKPIGIPLTRSVWSILDTYPNLVSSLVILSSSMLEPRSVPEELAGPSLQEAAESLQAALVVDV